MRDKSHTAQVERWANFVKSNPREVWKPRLNEIINAQFEISEDFYSRLKKSPGGDKILMKLKEERAKKGIRQ